MKNYKLWTSEEGLVQEYHSTIAPNNAIIWYDEQGNIAAIEPYMSHGDGTHHFYNRIMSEELDNWEVLWIFE